MLRIFTWNVHGQVDALREAFRYLSATARYPTIAVITEGPDAHALLRSSAKDRGVGSDQFTNWLNQHLQQAGLPWRWQIVIRMTSQRSVRVGQSRNQSHVVIGYLGPGKLGRHDCTVRAVRAEIETALPIHIVGLHARFSRDAIARNDRMAPFEAARAACRSIEEERGLKIIAGDFNEEPFCDLMFDSRGYRSRCSRPRQPPLPPYWANLTWQAVCWNTTGTFWNVRAKRWMWLDQILVDPNTAEHVDDVRVIRNIFERETFSLSDHAPVEALLRVEVAL